MRSCCMKPRENFALTPRNTCICWRPALYIAVGLLLSAAAMAVLFDAIGCRLSRTANSRRQTPIAPRAWLSHSSGARISGSVILVLTLSRWYRCGNLLQSDQQQGTDPAILCSRVGNSCDLRRGPPHQIAERAASIIVRPHGGCAMWPVTRIAES